MEAHYKTLQKRLAAGASTALYEEILGVVEQPGTDVIQQQRLEIQYLLFSCFLR